MIRLNRALRRSPLWTALPLAFLACRARAPERADTEGGTATVAINPSTSQGQIALELWQLRAGTTLGDWKGRHPEEPILGSDSSALARFLGPWCAFATHRAASGTLTIVRTAYFYAPPPPPSLAVPDTGALDLARQCVIGLMWVDVEVADSLGAASLADSVRRQLGTLYGAEVARPVQFFGSAFWSRTAWFSKDSLAAVTALRESAPGGRSGQGPRVVTAFAYLPISGVSAGGDAGPREAWTPVDTLPLDSALAMAQLDTALSSPLRAALREETAMPRGPGSGDSLVRPLVRWLRAAAPLAPPRRAAALYVADQVLDRAMCGHRLCEKETEPALLPLKALGAQFSWSELGGTEVYHHTWLTQARALARDTRLGEKILIAQLLSGFDFSGTCAGGAEGFRRVIENGERYLTRLPESPIAPDVHYLVGDAYRDIVALAHGAGGEYGDSSRYKAEAPDAARKALAHYLAAMRAGAGHPAARAAWSRAWWLIAGLVPRDVRFFCVYD